MKAIELLTNFSYHLLWNFGVLFIVLLAAILYLFLLPTSVDHKKKKTAMFLTGLLFFFLALGSPLNIMGRLLFRAHMIQMIILLFVSAPLIVYGFKWDLFERLMKRFRFKRFVHLLLNPLWAIAVFHLLFVLYHVPAVFNFVRVHYVWNYVSVFILFSVGLILWIPIFHSMRSFQAMEHSKVNAYFLVNGTLLLPCAILFILSPSSIYSIYSDPDLLISAVALCLPQGVTIDMLSNDLITTLLPFSPVQEQRMASVILLGSVVVIFSYMKWILARKKGISVKMNVGKSVHPE
ncbi:cytochrome c oxidase assembly protein [Bacillus sp. FJAT-47783]|uniref:cytochrome c oxidase assembly protein n=1 Tax=Bacillus sp. FJAT-47783 TaxID=2922712 RepID=UPI001FABB2FB|nr:cytochrome c oxidase assembly protein [Bacillus sp. FJAT-47783]